MVKRKKVSSTYRSDISFSPNIPDSDHQHAIKNVEKPIDRPYNIMTLTIRKEILFDDGLVQHEVYRNLERLQTENFNRIKIPKFTIKWDGDMLIYESEFIKGETIRSISDYEIMYEDLVLRDSDFSFNTFRPQNFIKNWRGEIYAIDLDDYREVSIEDRVSKWERSLRFFGHVVRAYNGKHRLQVTIYGKGQRQTKLEQLIDGMFSANIECKDLPLEFYGDFAIKIDDKLYDNYKTVMDVLKSMYLEFRSQIELNTDGTFKFHDWKPSRASVLFDSNNRTEYIG